MEPSLMRILTHLPYMQPTSLTSLPSQSSHGYAMPSTSSAASSLQGHTRDQLLDEAGRLESDIGQIRSRISEIEEQTRELAGFQDAVLQLTGQLSIKQLKLDEKKQRLSLVMQRLQELAGCDSRHVQPPAYPETLAGFSGMGADDPLPDFESLSLEDAEWFQAGLPR